MSWVLWAVVVLGLLAAALYLLDREIYLYEGKHLGTRIGPKIQAWLYDRWASKYDQDKGDSQADDAAVLARPLLAALGLAGRDREAVVLDVATGTGRLPLALFQHSDFAGRVIALDISREMLARAAAKLAPYRERTILVRHGTVPLPFPDNIFDAVCCLEALEIMPYMDQAAAELARVLKPGGVLLTTRGAETSGRTQVVRSIPAFTELLSSVGVAQIEITPWWKNFDRVLAVKPGAAMPGAVRELAGLLRCPQCQQVAMGEVDPRRLRCRQCGAEMPITADRIILG